MHAPPRHGRYNIGPSLHGPYNHPMREKIQDELDLQAIARKEPTAGPLNRQLEADIHRGNYHVRIVPLLLQKSAEGLRER